ncbi:ATP-dependent Clp protease adaptor ClpS [Zavarzinella formosa]|uniref:ATP-dependent Clp protease adaptor ClpS n=1 Tax=Zavarzinella formosa TaxID=360055 RepID=UPI00030DEF9A|nr:ATP-dependent Clp protease adaptor ClpS [Zavarzinella formosa]
MPPAWNSNSAPVAEPESKTRPKVQPPYHVLIENDDDHTMEFVIVVLQKVFGYSTEKSFELTLQAHTNGEAVVWTGSKEVAELKLDQILTHHEKHFRDGRPLGPLSCRIEPAI